MSEAMACNSSHGRAGLAQGDAGWKSARYLILTALALLLAAALGVQCFMLANPARSMAATERLARAEENERAALDGPAPMRIVNCIFFASSPEGEAPAVGWIPLARQDSAGRIVTEQIATIDTPILTDVIWFDPTRRCYRRVFYEGVRPIFAMACDGEALYFYHPRQRGGVTRQPLEASFQAVEYPTALFGLMAGLPISFASLAGRRPDQASAERLRYWGEMRVLGYEFPGRAGAEAGRWTLKVREWDQTLVEVAFAEGGATRFRLCRCTTERRPDARVAWDLSDLPQALD